MTPNWLPIRCDLHDDPAVISIAAAVGVDEFAVVGRLVRLWSWANEQLADGNAPGVTVSWIDRYLSLPGFAMAMVKAGWLTEAEGGVAFPKFDVWNSQGAKRRLLTSKRVQQHRANGNAKSNAPSVTGETQDALPRGRERVTQKESPTVSADAPPPVDTSKAKAPKAEPKPRSEPTGPHADVRRAFCERWKAKYGTDYLFDFGKHGKILKDLLAHVGGDVEAMVGIIERFLADDDPFFAADSRHDIGRLRQHFARWQVPGTPTTAPKPTGGYKTKQQQASDTFARLADFLEESERAALNTQGDQL